MTTGQIKLTVNDLWNSPKGPERNAGYLREALFIAAELGYQSIPDSGIVKKVVQSGLVSLIQNKGYRLPKDTNFSVWRLQAAERV